MDELFRKLIYDHPLDTGTQGYSLCADFLAAMEQAAPLEQTRCFSQGCAQKGQDQVVCPSGFWGFRHALGMPVSRGEDGEAPASIPLGGALRLAMAVSTDPALTLRSAHEQAIRALVGTAIAYADTREATLALLKRQNVPLAYFYCHGGTTGAGTPYLQVGPMNGETITAANLVNDGIRWQGVQPLVFLNGCHTTGLDPEAALPLVTGFVEESAAAGVIGTEITVFEPLARAFAEHVLGQVLGSPGTPVGEIVRRARLALLKQGNPLGLAYVPFVSPTLAFEAA